MNDKKELVEALITGNIDTIKRIRDIEKEKFKNRLIFCVFVDGKWTAFPWDVSHSNKPGPAKTKPMNTKEFADFIEKYDFKEVIDTTHMIYIQNKFFPEIQKEKIIYRVREAEAMKPMKDCNTEEMERIYGIKTNTKNKL